MCNLGAGGPRRPPAPSGDRLGIAQKYSTNLASGELIGNLLLGFSIIKKPASQPVINIQLL